MLKAYVSRSESVCPVLCVNENNCDECDDVKEICTSKHVSCHLASEQRAQINDLLNKFNDLFSDMPGITDLMVHKIRLTPAARPRRFPSFLMNHRNLIG